MGRGRKPEDAWMPLRVYRGKSKYEYKPISGKTIKLCALTAERPEVWAAYAEALKRAVLTVQDLADEYFKSRTFLRKRPKTQAGYRESWKTIAKVFAEVDAKKVQQKHVRAYMDKRGESGEVAANRDISLLHNVFAHAFERSKVKQNPCIGVKKFPEFSREKYIEDDEYYPFLEKSTPLIQLFMELSYLPGSRGQDVRMITLPDLREKGIYIRQGKTGKKQIKEWTPRLQDAVEAAKAMRLEVLKKLKGKVASQYLIVNKFGQPYSESGLKSVWAANKKRIKLRYDIKIDWTYHDIKAKGISDFDGDKQNFSGHKTARQAGDYDRRTHVVPTIQSDLRPLSRK